LGYYRPIDAWNMGKAQEFKERKYYKEGIVMNHIGG
jgi:anaerobic ribonucleoside-triphosphate reductase